MNGKFLPVIEDHSDGMSVFRNDMLDIEFKCDLKTIVKRFDVSDNVAPTLPLLRTGSLTRNGSEHVYVIDSLGSAWLENMDEMMESLPPEALAYFLLIADDPSIVEALNVISETSEEYNKEYNDQD